MGIERYDTFTTDAGSTGTVDIGSEGQSRTLIGYAVVWGAISSLRADGYRHQYERGSIVWTPIVNALWSHQTSTPLASTANGTLRISEDDIGARVEIDLDDTTDGENALKRVRNRLVSGMSFGGFRDPVDYALTANPQVRRITRILADEVTLTIAPAMTETRIAVASEAENLSAAMKEQQRRTAKNKLNKVRLSLLRQR